MVLIVCASIEKAGLQMSINDFFDFLTGIFDTYIMFTAELQLPTNSEFSKLWTGRNTISF